MAKITLSEAVHVSISLDGKAVELDLAVGENEVHSSVAEVLVAQGLVSDSSSKTSKKTSSTSIVEETPTTKESTEAN